MTGPTIGSTAPVSALSEVTEAARSAAPAEVWDFIEGGSGGELSVAANRTALDSVFLVPRVLRDVSRPRSGSRLLGSWTDMPVAIAPMAYQRLLHPDGELGTARAARAAGIPCTVPMFSSVAMEEVARSEAILWFQLYWLRDRGVTAALLERAESAGCTAVMLTVDVARLGRRWRDLRNGFTLPPGVRAAHFADTGPGAGEALDVSHYVAMFDPSLSWPDVEWLQARTRLPLVLKGVLSAADARAAVDCGAEALVVSNHGGRQLDGAVPGITALPAVREAVADGCALLLDGGIRSGLDVLKAIACGASGVLLGRLALHGLLAGGEAGLGRSLRLLRDELHDVLALAGCRDLQDAAELQLTRSAAG